jgi:hypothetical protein
MPDAAMKIADENAPVFRVVDRFTGFIGALYVPECFPSVSG